MSDKLTRSIDTNELHNETVIKEVHQLLKEGKTSQEVLIYARNKYSDDAMVDAIMEYFADHRNKQVKIATVFIDAFQRKYNNNFFTMSLSKFIKKALKYKKRYNLSDDEFDEIRRIFESRVFNTNSNLAQNNVIYPNTNISRVLGYPVVETTDSIKPTNSDDYSYLQDLLRMYNMYRSVHSYVVIQTMLYTDLSEEALNGKFEINRHNVNNYVHPVLAALFLPKFHHIEERMLYANIAGIINTRYNKERIITKPDYELFYSMVVDPADTVCDIISPMRDLKNRAEVQFHLWNNIYNLRNGKYYEVNSIDFIANIDKCKISNVDNPDLLYLSDEGVILRRLFSVFSFRPIIVQTIPIFGVVLNNPLNLPINTNTITSIPYITYKLPNVQIEGQNYNLSDSNNQVQFYMENGSFVPKATQIIEARGPIIFYVPRRMAQLPVAITDPRTNIFGYGKLGNSSLEYQGINVVDINFDCELSINNVHGENKYILRSAVAFENYNDTKMILGHLTFLFKYLVDSNNKIINSIPTESLIYIPRKANLIENKGIPILLTSYIEAKSILQNYGTIFIYGPDYIKNTP
jgi:hypothetical protein